MQKLHTLGLVHKPSTQIIGNTTKHDTMKTLQSIVKTTRARLFK